MTAEIVSWTSVSYQIRDGFWLKYKSILKRIDMGLPCGAVVGLVGANGAGKTTLMKLGAGILSPSRGRVDIHGVAARTAKARARIGFLTEQQYLYPNSKLYEWLEMLGRLSGLSGKTLRYRIDQVADQFDLQPFLHSYMRTISKGQLQRAGISQVFLHEPDILFLDEPMSGLDPYWRKRLMDILLKFKQGGGSILFSSHILYDVEKLADTIYVIEKGAMKDSDILRSRFQDIQAYEIEYRCADPVNPSELNAADDVIPLPNGHFQISISPEKKNEWLQLSVSGAVDIIELRAVQLDIQDTLRGN
ncbi:MAG: hypothetical protein CSA22_04750 [Deltaproteobacteria bacterium]|nr:MAG: hypothetical protein CSA22_04750 [Deltaproteobacteria bacterium]